MPSQKIFLPPQWAIQGRIEKNPLSQMSRAVLEVEATLQPVKNGHLCVWSDTAGQEHQTFILSKKPASIPPGGPEILLTPDGNPLTSEVEWEIHRSKTRWVYPMPGLISEVDMGAMHGVAESVLASWQGLFSFEEEQTHANGTTKKPGLRPAQVGALHAILAHWTMVLGFDGL